MRLYCVSSVYYEGVARDVSILENEIYSVAQQLLYTDAQAQRIVNLLGLELVDWGLHAAQVSQRHSG